VDVEAGQHVDAEGVASVVDVLCCRQQGRGATEAKGVEGRPQVDVERVVALAGEDPDAVT
jgi:hypothetical protein